VVQRVGGAEKVFVAVLVVVDFVACFGLFLFQLNRFATSSPYYEFGIGILVGRIFGQV
jgi:hypothetical protein